MKLVCDLPINAKNRADASNKGEKKVLKFEHTKSYKIIIRFIIWIIKSSIFAHNILAVLTPWCALTAGWELKYKNVKTCIVIDLDKRLIIGCWYHLKIIHIISSGFLSADLCKYFHWRY